MMKSKLGLIGDNKDDLKLINSLLNWMEESKADYTNTFCHLMDIKIDQDKNFEDINFLNWKKRWHERLKINKNTSEKNMKLMRSVNPVLIPRNHKVEKALETAEKGDYKSINQLIEVLKNPYSEKKNILEYQIPLNSNENYQTFCGT